MSSVQRVHVLGLKASCLALISKVRPLMRPIQLQLLHFWNHHSETAILHFVDHLNWWLKRVNILKGNSFES